MRNLYITILSLASIFLFVSCSKSDDTKVSMHSWPLLVEVEQLNSKVSLSSDGTLKWQEDDRLAFVAISENYVSVQTELTLNRVDAGLTTAKFKGNVSMAEEPERCIFAYPSTSVVSETSVVYDYAVQSGTHMPFLYGQAPYSADEISCTMQHVGGMLRIAVADGVESLTICGNNGENFSKVVYNADGSVEPAADASNSVEVPVNGSVAYIAMPPLNFTKGFSIICSHKDGSKMFKSYSSDGGVYSGYTFLGGSLIDLDLTSYEGFTADCKVTAEHQYDSDGLLTGTEVKLSEFTYKGAPSKIIGQWGVAVIDSKGELARWTYGEGAYAGQTSILYDYIGSLPLLHPDETYSVYAICNINGQDLMFKSSQTFSVGHPDIKVTKVTAKTSWTYYNEGNVSEANKKDNDAIFDIAATVNVHPNLLTEAYDFKVNFTSSGKTIPDEKLLSNSNTFTSSSSFNGMDWNVHSITANVSFAGKTYSGVSEAVYVTGLPYEANWMIADQTDWVYIGKSGYGTNGVGYRQVNSGGAGFISPAFNVKPVTVSTAVAAQGRNVDFSLFGSVLDKASHNRFYIYKGTRSSGMNNSGDVFVMATYSTSGNPDGNAQTYVDCSTKFSLDSSNPCLVYSTNYHLYNKLLFKIKINYAE